MRGEQLRPEEVHVLCPITSSQRKRETSTNGVLLSHRVLLLSHRERETHSQHELELDIEQDGNRVGVHVTQPRRSVSDPETERETEHKREARLHGASHEPSSIGRRDQVHAQEAAHERASAPAVADTCAWVRKSITAWVLPNSVTTHTATYMHTGDDAHRWNVTTKRAMSIRAMHVVRGPVGTRGARSPCSRRGTRSPETLQNRTAGTGSTPTGRR